MIEASYDSPLFYAPVEQPLPVMAYGKKPSFLNNTVNLAALNSQLPQNYSQPQQQPIITTTPSTASPDYLQQLDCPPLTYSPRSSVVSPDSTSSIFTPDMQQQQQQVFPQQAASDNYLVSLDNSLFTTPFFAMGGATPTLPTTTPVEPSSFTDLFSSTTPASETFCDPKALALPEEQPQPQPQQQPQPIAIPTAVAAAAAAAAAAVAPAMSTAPAMIPQFAPIYTQQYPTRVQYATAPALTQDFSDVFQITTPQEYFVLQSNAIPQLQQQQQQQQQRQHQLRLQSQPQAFQLQQPQPIQFYQTNAVAPTVFNPLPITPVSPRSSTAAAVMAASTSLATFPTPSPSPVSLKRSRDELSRDEDASSEEDSDDELLQAKKAKHGHGHGHCEQACCSDSCVSTPASSQASESPSPSPAKVSAAPSYRRARKPAVVDDDSKTFTCEHCDRKFRRQEHLKRHFRSLHTREKPFECELCGKTFSRSDNLSQHARVHTKQQPLGAPAMPVAVSSSSDRATRRSTRKSMAL